MFSRIKSFAAIVVGLFAALPLRLLTAAAGAQTEPVRFGILTGNSSPYADNGGQGSFIAGQWNQ
jgi:hypothetical protein